MRPWNHLFICHDSIFLLCQLIASFICHLYNHEQHGHFRICWVFFNTHMPNPYLYPTNNFVHVNCYNLSANLVSTIQKWTFVTFEQRFCYNHMWSCPVVAYRCYEKLYCVAFKLAWFSDVRGRSQSLSLPSLSRLIYSVRSRVRDVRAPFVYEKPITARVGNESWKSKQISFPRVFPRSDFWKAKIS